MPTFYFDPNNDEHLKFVSEENRDLVTEKVAHDAEIDLLDLYRIQKSHTTIIALSEYSDDLDNWSDRKFLEDWRRAVGAQIDHLMTREEYVNDLQQGAKRAIFNDKNQARYPGRIEHYLREYDTRPRPMV